MSTRAMNFKIDESDIVDMKQVAAVFNITMTQMVKEALKDYLERMKNDPYYKLSVNVQDASPEESEEILDEIKNMSDDDLAIISSESFDLDA